MLRGKVKRTQSHLPPKQSSRTKSKIAQACVYPHPISTNPNLLQLAMTPAEDKTIKRDDQWAAKQLPSVVIRKKSMPKLPVSNVWLLLVIQGRMRVGRQNTRIYFPPPVLSLWVEITAV
jgi:hypothetical protein